MSAEHIYDGNKQWLKERMEKYPFAAAVTIKIRPENISEREYGPHASAPTQIGLRIYLFTTQMARDNFVYKYHGIALTDLE